jgi:hypothetical protein
MQGVDWIFLLEQGPVAGSCQHGNEPSVRLRGGECIG